jgi:hypothetical protein
MSGFAYLREDEGSWADQDLRTLDGSEFDGSTIKTSVVKAICFDAMLTGLYVLTDDDDHYFTCHSIALDFADDVEMLKILERENA